MLILLLAAALRMHELTRHALWSDEIYTLQSSAGFGLESKRLAGAGLLEPAPDLLSLTPRRPWWTVATSLARDDNHPPLYFLLIRAWREVFGDSDAALRGFSVLCSVAALTFLFDVARHLHGLTTALWAALLMALAMPQIHYAQEARSYALMLLLGMAACSALVRIERRGATAPRLAALGACTLALLLTHYYAIAPIAALGLYALIRLRGAARGKAMFTLAAGIVLFLSLWGWALWQQRLNLAPNNWYISDPSAHPISATFRRVAQLPMRFLAEPRPSAQAAAALAAVLLVIPFLLLRRRPDLLLWGLWLACVIGLVALVDLLKSARQLEFLRYTLLASTAVYALVPALLSNARPQWLRHALPALAAGACLLALPATYADPATPKLDARILARLIDREAGDEDVILFYGAQGEDAGIMPMYYLTLRHYAHRMPRAVIFTAEPEPDTVTLDRLRRSTGVWTVTPQAVTIPHEFLEGLSLGPRATVFGLPSLQRSTRGRNSDDEAGGAG